MIHFKDCPIKRGYNCCTCDMCGEEIAVIEWQIAKQENRLSWWKITARFTLHSFSCGKIERVP